ncbi:ectonucleotide pyrophosphatase/phosphodiesterase [Melioribacteraceae bacterium 4301-Me]|uniref:alkaline phosphatase family protein n=1 Tax=Pyranulibacter aquaticus TaxID=3163344 RepID=UPI003595885A
MKKTVLFILLLFYSFNITFSQGKPYVILISLDGFRWDYLDRNITPNINKIINSGVRAISLRSCFPTKTFPNHQSIITGMYIDHHGIIGNNFQDPYSYKFYMMRDTASLRDPSWYLGEAFWQTAERQGIKTASYFWPGSEIHLKYRRPSYYEEYYHFRPNKERINQVIKWLQLPQKDRPHFITLYFSVVDDSSHVYGPNSPQTNLAIQIADSAVGLLEKKLNDIGMQDSVNVIIVSDHGMTEISSERVIDVGKILNGYKCQLWEDGPIMLVYPQNDNLRKVYEVLKKNENHYKTYYKSEMPEYYHYSENPFISPIILIADMGWSLVRKREIWIIKDKGNHGYDNNALEMQGIFVASGPAFKKNYKTGTLWNIDIYPLLCKIFNIVPRSNIDGKLERIEFVLK